MVSTTGRLESQRVNHLRVHPFPCTCTNTVLPVPDCEDSSGAGASHHPWEEPCQGRHLQHYQQLRAAVVSVGASEERRSLPLLFPKTCCKEGEKVCWRSKGGGGDCVYRPPRESFCHFLPRPSLALLVC
ncbi:hypothetical protein CLOP_g4001 [Closterium sp. NIES-67]|nr:hypothetical protein CLOP_g4001 [Closterium sp. NIES-67]